MSAQSRRAVLAVGAAASLHALPLLSVAAPSDAVETLRRASEEFARVVASAVPPAPPEPTAGMEVAALVTMFREADASVPLLKEMETAISAAFSAVGLIVDEHGNRDGLAGRYLAAITGAQARTTHEARVKLSLATWCASEGYHVDDVDALWVSAFGDLARLGAAI